MKNIFSNIIYTLAKSEIRNIIFIFFLTSICMVFELIGIGLIIPILTIFAEGSFADYAQYLPFLTADTKEQSLILILLFLILVYFFKMLFLSYTFIKEQSFTHNLYINTSKKLLKNYLHKNYLFHVKNNSASLIRNILEECNIYVFAVIAPLIRIFSKCIMFISICGFLIWYDLKISLITIVFFTIVGLILYTITSLRLKVWGNTRQKEEYFVIKNLQQSLGSIKEIILYGAQKFFLNKYNLHNTNRIIAARNRVIVSHLPRLFLEFIVILFFSAIIFYLLKINQNLSDVFVLLGVFIFASIRLLPITTELINAFQQLKYNLPVIDIMYKEIVDYNKNFELFDLENKISNKTFKKIKLHNIGFNYSDNNNYVLKDINFEINSGDKIAITGETGSGKTTLINLICGLITCSSGSIEIDGKNIKENLLSWQSSIGYVPQSVYISDESLLENITLGKKINNLDKVNEILRLVQMDKFVKNLSQGIETKLGEKGSKLSGGQIQRIGIARALFRDPSIILLDESTNALDENIENSILDLIFNKMKGKTIIIISHNKKSFKYCNRIFETSGDTVKENK